MMMARAQRKSNPRKRLLVDSELVEEKEVVEEEEALLGAEDDRDPVSEMHSPTQ